MAGIFTQQEKLAKSIYILISEYFNKPENIVKITKTGGKENTAKIAVR